MEFGINRSRECLQSYTMAWRELAEAIQRCSASLVKMDLEGIYRQIARQEELCAKIRTVAAELRACERFGPRATDFAPPQSAGTRKPEAAENSRLLENELAAAQKQVRQCNQILKAVLARSARTVNMRANALVNQFATYPPPRSGKSRISL